MADLISNMKQSVAVIGCGNIGSPLCGFIARMPLIEHVTLVDSDRYEEKNLGSQDITRADVGKPKAAVQARRMRRINPTLKIDAIISPVERVPLGRLRADAIVACLDSRAARMAVNQIAYRLGMPWIDTGVRPDSMLARVNIYRPGKEEPCYECKLDQRHYDAMRKYPCDKFKTAPAPAPTNGFISLGALSASMAACELHKLLSGETQRVAFGKQLVYNARELTFSVSAMTRNPSCRFDHAGYGEIRAISAGPRNITFDDIMDGGHSLRLEGAPFVTKLTCPDDGATKSMLYVHDRMTTAHRKCPKCGKAGMIAGGFDLRDRLQASEMTARDRSRSLACAGITIRDIVLIGRSDGSEAACEIGNTSQGASDQPNQ